MAEKRMESLRRKLKYKEILERGTSAAEESEGHSIVENLNIIEGLLIDSNKLISEGEVSDRIGYTTEVLMDVQVNNGFFIWSYANLNWPELLAISQFIGCQNGMRFNGHHCSANWQCEIFRWTVCGGHCKFRLSGTASIHSKEVFHYILHFYLQRRTITDENGHIDWSKLDAMATNVISAFRYAPAIGDAGIKFTEITDESQIPSQKQRQVRKKTELAVETKPMALTQQEVGQKDMGSMKLREIHKQIKAVRL